MVSHICLSCSRSMLKRLAMGTPIVDLRTSHTSHKQLPTPTLFRGASLFHSCGAWLGILCSWGGPRARVRVNFADRCAVTAAGSALCGACARPQLGHEWPCVPLDDSSSPVAPVSLLRARSRLLSLSVTYSALVPRLVFADLTVPLLYPHSKRDKMREIVHVSDR